MTSKTSKQEKFAVFLMTGDTIIKKSSVLQNSINCHSSNYEYNYGSFNPPFEDEAADELSNNTSQPLPIATITQPKKFVDREIIAHVKNLEVEKEVKLDSDSGDILFTPRRKIELEIPPDDISAEDEQFKEAGAIVEDLPPPPAHFFHQSTSSDGFCKFTSIKKDELYQENVSCSNSNGSLGVSSPNVTKNNKAQRFSTTMTSYSSENELLKESSKHTLKRSVECDDLKSPETIIQDQLGSQTRVYRSHENYLQMMHPIDLSPMLLEEPGAVSVDALNYEKIESSLNNVEAFLNSNDLCDIIDFSKRNSNFQPPINFPHHVQSQPQINSHCIVSQVDNHLNSKTSSELSQGSYQSNTSNNIKNQGMLVQTYPANFTSNLPLSDTINQKRHQTPTTNNIIFSPNKQQHRKQNLTATTTTLPQNNSSAFLEPAASASQATSKTSNTPVTKISDNQPDLLTIKKISCADVHEKTSHPSLDLACAHSLAQQLYNLNGFTMADVCKHLSKNDPFSLLVSREYMRNFDFSNLDLDTALRNFLGVLVLEGETQEKERVLSRFSHRLLQQNPSFELSEDACHTLVCAILLLNTDLHSQSVQQKMTLNEFIKNLQGLNDNGTNYPPSLLASLFHSIAADPLPSLLPTSPSSELPANLQLINPFLVVPDVQNAKEYKKGYMMKKNCVSAGGRRTSLGKRSWQMYFVVLRDMVMYLYKDSNEAAKANKQGFQNGLEHRHKCLRVHHSFARLAPEYQKKQFVFRLNTCDQAEYLFQSSDGVECQSWVDQLNMVAACLSGPPLPSGVGSQKKSFQRPLMPSAYTKFNLREQYENTLSVLEELEESLKVHRAEAPKGGKVVVQEESKEKEKYLLYEIERFTLYCKIMKDKLNGFIL